MANPPLNLQESALSMLDAAIDAVVQFPRSVEMVKQYGISEETIRERCAARNLDFFFLRILLEQGAPK